MLKVLYQFPNQNMNSKENAKEYITKIRNNFAKGALWVKKAGFDGVKIH